MIDPQRVLFLLVATSHPGNVGAAARAMKTMGFHRLGLVAPACEPGAKAETIASHAADLIAGAGRFPDLDQAVAGATLVLGVTARPRRYGVPALDPGGAAELIAGSAGPVTLVFGRERTGLTNRELERCHRLVHIPANPDYPSLNLAAAVQILAYELHRQASGPARTTTEGLSGGDPATGRHLEGLFEHLERVVAASGYDAQGNPELLRRRLRNLFNRARPTAEEVNLLRGLFKRLERRLP